MSEPYINERIQVINYPEYFPSISISAINCNSLNMSTVTKHIRLRKFYGICSLKTDVIFISDLRMCNKAGQTDAKFAHETFSVNPYSSYNFIPHSNTNSRGVGILVKKSLKFTCLDTECDPVADNFLLIRASLQDNTVILGSIYGPNKRDDDFFTRLSTALNRLGKYPIVIGGDWNATPSCLPVHTNLDVCFMQDVPNATHSKKIRGICNDFELCDPFRVLYPNLREFSYSPWGNLRKNRSRIDFFLVSTSIAPKVEECCIKQSVQSKLFDHRAIVLDFKKIKPISSRPNISNSILRDPDIDIVVNLANLECYAQKLDDGNFKDNVLNRIGTCFSKLREAGPDPTHVEYAHAELTDLDARIRLKDDIRILMEELNELNLPDINHNMEDDAFLEFLMNNIRNEVISYQSFINKTINLNVKKITDELSALKKNYVKNFERISDLELKMREINDLKVSAILEKNSNFST
jgi:exonuclease III